jgi:hypothetical protein
MQTRETRPLAWACFWPKNKKNSSVFKKIFRFKEKKKKKMVRVTIDGCARTSGGGTAPEWATVILTAAATGVLTMSKYLHNDKHVIIGVLVGVLVAAMFIGMLERSCKDKIDEANTLTSPQIEKPTCVKTHSGFTSFQLAYVVLAAFACVMVRERDSGRILAVTLGGIALISWVLGLIFKQRCSSKLN